MCSGARKEGSGRAGDLPRGAVIAVSQHLNEGRIERSHGHGGKGEERLSLPSPDSPLSQPLPPSNSIQERRSRTMNTSQLLLKEEEAASAIGHTRRKGPAAAAASAFKGRTSWAEQGKRGPGPGSPDPKHYFGHFGSISYVFCPEFLCYGHCP